MKRGEERMTDTGQSVKYLDYENFKRIVIRNYGEGSIVHGELDDRWTYHSRVIDILRSAKVTRPEQVLEVGTMGTQLVQGADTLDYAEKWNFEGLDPTYWHDARMAPWPIPDKQYEWLVAMRVFHHLYPAQREAFQEARRVARNVVIIVPRVAPQRAPTDRGITPMQFYRWNGGIPPMLWEPVPVFGSLYVWSDREPPMLQGAFWWRAGVTNAKLMVKKLVRTLEKLVGTR